LSYRSNDTHGSSEPDQISGRRELDEGPAATDGSAPEADEDLLVEDDGPWYMGKAREEFNRRMRDAAAPRDDEDPVQVIRPAFTSHP
jgi:SEL1 protein